LSTVLISGPNHGTAGEVYVGKIDYIPGSDFFLEALAAQGIPTGDLNSGEFSYGYSKVDYNLKEGLRQSSFHAFLEPILHRTNLKIYRYAWADKVSSDNTHFKQVDDDKIYH
jgi:choline dehydrogenase